MSTSICPSSARCQNMPVKYSCIHAHIYTRNRVHTHTRTHTHTHTQSVYHCNVLPVRRHMCDNCIVMYNNGAKRRYIQGLTCHLYMSVRHICHAYLTCIYDACKWKIAKKMNLGNVGYYMHLVLYFGVIIRSSFGGVSEHKYIYRYIQSHSVRLIRR
jgi:hypothetical protein